VTNTVHEAIVNASGASPGAPPAYPGWHLVAFADDLSDVTPVDVGARRLVAIRDGDRVRVFDATCPHRGSHLGYGGRLDRGCLICPFHGRRVHLGLDQRGEYQVAEQPSVQVGDAIFVRLDDGPDHGFASMVAELTTTHSVLAAFTVPVRVEASIVVENAFDPEHFGPVHGILTVPDMAPYEGPDGELIVESELVAPGRAGWESPGRQTTSYRFFARAFSPSLVVTQLGPAGPSPYFFTGTTPTPEGCTARVAMAVPNRPDGSLQSPMYIAGLVAGAREAFREDTPVWEHLAPNFAARYDARDRAVLAFREFVARFTG
jgi:3-ketosteroid 9alpha-monooxygenase subunit A